MRLKTSARLIAPAVIAFLLSACASRTDVPASAGPSDDDDAYCRGNAGPLGSQQYVACRKDRDVQRSNAIGRADRRQRDLSEWMLNHPDRP